MITLWTGLTLAQMTNNLTSQAATMVTNGVPNDVINNLDPLALIIFIPIFDLFLYPGLRRIGINPTPVKKITGGFIIGSLAMVWATVVQHYIYQVCLGTFFNGVTMLADSLCFHFRPTHVETKCLLA